MSSVMLDIIPSASFAILNTQWWQPEPILERWIQCIWTTPKQCHAQPLHPDKLYPDAGASLVIELNAHRAECFYFFNTKTIQHTWDPSVNRLCIRLKPGAITQILSTDFLEMTNVLVPLNEPLLPNISTLLVSLIEQSVATQVALVQAWLMTRISSAHKTRSTIVNLVSLLHHHVVNPYVFAAEKGMSRRTLERKLRAEMGITPKQLHAYNRIRKARNLLLNSELSLTDIALEAGYYDQAHFTNAFHASNFETPAQYQQRKMSHFSKAAK